MNLRLLIPTTIFLFCVSTFPIQATVTIEQHINLLDQEYTATESAVPNDNRLGMVYYDQDVYNDETVYFEAIIKCTACSGGNSQTTATLYTAAGSPVTNASVSTTDTNYALVRSAAITSNLADNTLYTVRLSRDATAGTAAIVAARMIIVQSAANITATETQIEVGSSTQTTNTAWGLPLNPKILNYQSANYAPTPTITFEASLKSSTADAYASAALSASGTCASTVTGSSISVQGTTWAKPRSSSFSLDSGVYYVCLKSETDATAYLANAKLILTQSAGGGIAKVKLYLPTHTTPFTDSDDSYTSPGASISFNPSNFAGANFSYYYESILQTTGGSAYSLLYDTETELATNQTAFAQVTSPEITGRLPTSTTPLNTQLKNSATNTTTSSGSWLMVVMAAYPSLSFSIEGVNSGVTTNGMATSVTSQNDELDFGSLITSSPKYIAHRLSASANTASGYTVSIKMLSTLQGNYPANVIEEFPATWSSPTTWTEPTGTTANVNTGWFGANTSDTRVSGWQNGSSLFGPVGTTSRPVMQSTGVDSGTNIYVTYAIEVNQHQPFDTYSGVLVYSILPTY